MINKQRADGHPQEQPRDHREYHPHAGHLANLDLVIVEERPDALDPDLPVHGPEERARLGVSASYLDETEEQQRERRIEQELDEKLDIELAHAVARPRTVVVEPAHAALAVSTVPSPDFLDPVAGEAVQLVVQMVEEHLADFVLELLHRFAAISRSRCITF